jgi:nucleotide-binding universal stress UspA family protein
MGLQNLVVAVDDSAAGRNAARFGAYLAGLLGAELTVLSVCPNPVPGHQGRDDCADAVHAMMESVFVAHPALSLEVAAVHGIPQIEIPRFAEGKKAGLIVLGRKPRSRATRLILGDTTDAVIRRSRIPCLMVPAGLTSMHRLVAALDGSDRGMAVFRAATELAAATNLELGAVTVDPAQPGEPAMASARSERLSAKVDAACHLAGGATRWGGNATAMLRVRHGDVVEEIAREVQDTGADILVTGFHPGGPLLVVEEGSVSRTLVHSVPCAVMTVPL